MGFLDEVWWSRFAHPTLPTWAADGQFQKLQQQVVSKDDPDRQALACYGSLIGQPLAPMLFRFVEGRPVSAITTQFLVSRSRLLRALVGLG